MKKILIAYVPVIHEGYRRFFDRVKGVETIYLFGTDIIKKFDYLRKEVRALSPADAAKALSALFPELEVQVLDTKKLDELTENQTHLEIHAPNEDVTKELIAEYLPKSESRFYPYFLRWNRDNVLKEEEVEASRTIEANEAMSELFAELHAEAMTSADWWRTVAGAIVRDGELLLIGNNRYGQSPHVVNADGDPRIAYNRGVNIDLTTSLHAERGLISEAARQGIPLEGADMYVTTYPCPTCAKAIAAAGLKRLYFTEGYAVLDGKEVLDRAGVEIIKVLGIDPPEKGEEYVPYPKKK